MFPTLGEISKEQQSINELERKINIQKAKLNKKMTRQKIILGAFFAEALEKNELEGLREYTAKWLPAYLTRESEKVLFEDLLKKIDKAEVKEEASGADNKKVSGSQNQQTLNSINQESDEYANQQILEYETSVNNENEQRAYGFNRSHE